jgi:hypothetical protein
MSYGRKGRNASLNYVPGKLRPHAVLYTMMRRSVGAKKFNPPIPTPLANP